MNTKLFEQPKNLFVEKPPLPKINRLDLNKVRTDDIVAQIAERRLNKENLSQSGSNAYVVPSIS